MKPLLVVLAVLAAGCATMQPAPTPPVATPTPGAFLAPQSAIPTDAAWPADMNLSHVEPTSLRLEIPWRGAPPTDVTLAVRVNDMEAPLPVNATMGSLTFTPGATPDPNATLTLRVGGGLVSLMHSAPDLVVAKRVDFAGRGVEVPILNGTAPLVLRGAQSGSAFAMNVTLAPRTREEMSGQLYFSNRTFGMNPHPAGNIHVLEDGARLVWAEGDALVGVGSGRLDHDAPYLDVLVLTGMDGWVARVNAT